MYVRGAKLVSILIKSNVIAFKIDILAFVVIAGVIGAVCGRLINRKLSDKAEYGIYTSIQAIVIIMCIISIVRSLFT